MQPSFAFGESFRFLSFCVPHKYFIASFWLVLLHSIHWRRRWFCESRVPGLVHAVRHLCAVCHAAAAAQVVRCGRHNHRQLSPGRNYHQEIAGQGGESRVIVQFNFGLCLIWHFWPLQPLDANCVLFQIIANFILYTAINVAGMYTKYLTDRGQRLAFIETHKAMEHKKESEKELQRTQKLLDSSK